MSKLSLRAYGIILRIRLAWFKLINPAGYEEVSRKVDQSTTAIRRQLEREREESRLRGEVWLTDLQLAALRVVNQSTSQVVSQEEVRQQLLMANAASSRLASQAVQRVLNRLAELEILQQLNAGYYRRLKSSAAEMALIEAEELRRQQFMQTLLGQTRDS